MVFVVRKRAAVAAVVPLIFVALCYRIYLLRKALGVSLSAAVTLLQPLPTLQQTANVATTSADLYGPESVKSQGEKNPANIKLLGLLAPPERAAHPLASERDEWSSGYPCPENQVGAPAGSQASVDKTTSSEKNSGSKYNDADVDDDVWRAVEKQSEHEPSIALCTVIRNEAGFLDEWIAFHWLQGVRKFILYDHYSSDNTCQVLHKYVQRGIVDYREISDEFQETPGEVVQLKHLNRCLFEVSAAAAATAAIQEEKSADQDAEGNQKSVPTTTLSRKIDWVLLSDVDEYAYAKAATMTLAQALDAHYSNQPCVHIYRKDFGTSGRFRRPSGGLLMENYVLSAPTHRGKNPVKLLVNVRPEKLPRLQNPVTNIPHPHGIHTNEGFRCADHRTEHLQMNQYLRSLYDYDSKINTHYQGPNGKYQKDPLKHFWDRDQNDVIDDSAPRRYACAVRQLLAYWTTTVIDVEKKTTSNGTALSPPLSDNTSSTNVSPSVPENKGTRAEQSDDRDSPSPPAGKTIVEKADISGDSVSSVSERSRQSKTTKTTRTRRTSKHLGAGGVLSHRSPLHG